jgi:hypothetical protein
LQYFIQSLENQINLGKDRADTYQQAQKFRDKLQTQLNQILVDKRTEKGRIS